MRVSRLYLPQPLASHTEVVADASVGHYLRDVLRMRKDDVLRVFDGRGGEYEAAIIEIHRQGVRLAVGRWLERDLESPLAVELGLGISRGERMDFAIQKAVELGVARIVPLLTERTVVQLAGERRAQRRDHWQKIAVSACEQSGRCCVPEVADPAPLQQWLQRAQGLRLYCDPRAECGLRALHAPADGRVSLLSGPEGGFSDTERTQSRQAGFQGVTLGPRVLRTETAALAVLASVQLLWGDLG